MKKLIGLIAIPLLAINLMLPVAAEAKIDFASGEELNLAGQSYDDDLMAAGAMLEGEFTVIGDSYLAGSMVDITGSFGDDLNVAGSQVDLKGYTVDNLRAAGGDVTVNMNIDGNLMMAGGQVLLDEGSVVAGDAYIAGGNVVVKGHVMGDLHVAGGRVVLDGKFDGNVIVDAEEVKLSDMSLIGGNFDYTSTQELDQTVAGQIEGDVSYTKYEEIDTSGLSAGMGAMGIIARVTDFVVGMLMLFVVGLLLVLLAPGFSDKVNNLFIKRMGWSLLIGIVVVIVWFVVSLFLLFTIIGIPLALILFALFGVTLYLAKILAAFSIGSVLIGRKKSGWAILLLALALGLLVYEIIAVIPFIGWIFNMIFVSTAVGAMIWHVYDLRFGQKKELEPVKAVAKDKKKK